MNDIDVLLTMIENPTRRRILESLVKEPHYPLQLSKELGISQQAVMKNLNVLEKNGFVISYQESSSMGPMRTVYQPMTEFSLVIDMRNGMFSTKVMKPQNIENNMDQDSEINPKDIRDRISAIDTRLEELNKERSGIIREREQLIASAMNKLTGIECTYVQRNLIYELMNNPNKTLNELSSDMDMNLETVNSMIEDIRDKIADKRREV